LGFGSNVLYLWESGRRTPTSRHFLDLATSVGVDVEAAVGGFVQHTASAKLNTAEGMRDFLQRLRGQLSALDLSRALGCDRSTVARWLAGKSDPPFTALLAFIDIATHRLLDFVALFVSPATLAATRAAFEALSAQRALAYEDPWSHAVLRALELTAPRARLGSQVQFIAQRTGLLPSAVETALKRLSRAAQVHKRGNRWRAVRALPVDTRNDPEANFRLKQHWLAVAEERLAKTHARGEGLYSYNLFAVTAEGYERIRKLHVDYFEKVRAIVSEERGGARVVLANFQLVPLDE
jgi:transcriptional regulator with XRE-family HTH domain